MTDCTRRNRNQHRPTLPNAHQRTWIWFGLPAVMLEMVQQASLRIPSFGLLSNAASAWRAPQLTTTCVCTSSPVTMFPTERNAGV